MPKKIESTFVFTCVWCEKSEERRDTVHNRRQRFCSKACSASWRMSREDYKHKIFNNEARTSKLRKATTRIMAERPDLRKAIADRMKAHNPMCSEVVKRKQKLAMKTKHTLGNKTIRGGNGSPPTKAEQILLARLPELKWNYAVSLGKRTPGYPTHYKLDLAAVEQRVGIEVDGKSHCLLERQAQDRKKEAKLTELGWYIVRFTNQQVLENVEEVVRCIQSLLQDV